jgi:hypothetical protein
MTDQPSARQQKPSFRWSRALYGGAASLVAFVLARLLASMVYPIGIYPFHNQILFMGTPYLALAFLLPGLPSLAVGAANAVNATFWAVLGAAVALLIRRPLIAVGVWLLVAVVGSGLVFVMLILGMM